jgi:hypothetical protein
MGSVNWNRYKLLGSEVHTSDIRNGEYLTELFRHIGLIFAAFGDFGSTAGDRKS